MQGSGALQEGPFYMLPSLFPYGAILFAAAAAPNIIPVNGNEKTALVASSPAAPTEFTCFSHLKDVGSPCVLGQLRTPGTLYRDPEVHSRPGWVRKQWCHG